MAFVTGWTRLFPFIAAAVVACVGGCAPDADVTAPTTTVRIPPDPALPGTVSAVGPTDVAVDIGTARPVIVKLAGVAAVDCGPGGSEAFAAGLRELAPVGAAVVLVRSNGPAHPGQDLAAFVHTSGRPGDRTVSGASINEQLVVSGRARIDPPVDHSVTAAPVEDQITEGAASVPEPDRDYRGVLAETETRAWQTRTGPIGVCAARQDELDRSRETTTAPAPGIESPPVTSAPPSRLHIEITVQPPPRRRPCELIDRC
ncbi:hypothetical protein [Nocardia sp. BMG51109]|uniref:hypothetical protein n=1 Tax=Nocardia sp. BMG51109 TaxID=1056816 RepID=UPI0004665ED8|nr:hypothetical protein [Nocardia sp. BMG51109]